MLFILEGCDGTGKSTFAKKLVEYLGSAEILHKGPPVEHPLTEYETPLFDYRPGTDQHIICDRWHLGEWVYPDVLGRESKVKPGLRAHIELFLRAKGALLVGFSEDVTVIAQRLNLRGDDLITPRMLPYITAIYQSLFEDSFVPTIEGTTQLKTIVSVASRYDRLAAEVISNGSYVGASRPQFLLVGERRFFAEPYPPAFGPYPATSGAWMFESLMHTGYIPPNKYSFANAFEEDLEKLWLSLHKPMVVALGRIPQEQLKKAGVPHGAVPHPQFMRRFYHKHKDVYPRLINEAASYERDLIRWRP